MGEMVGMVGEGGREGREGRGERGRGERGELHLFSRRCNARVVVLQPIELVCSVALCLFQSAFWHMSLQ